MCGGRCGGCAGVGVAVSGGRYGGCAGVGVGRCGAIYGCVPGFVGGVRVCVGRGWCGVGVCMYVGICV